MRFDGVASDAVRGVFRIGSIIAFTIGTLFLATGLATLFVAVYDPAWQWIDRNSGSGCTYSTGRCTDDVVVTMSIVGGIFAGIGAFVVVITLLAAKRAPVIVAAAFDELFGGLAPANPDAHFRGASPRSSGGLTAAELKSEGDVRALLSQIGLNLPESARIFSDSPGVITVDARPENDADDPSEMVAAPSASLTPSKDAESAAQPPRAVLDEATLRATGIAASATIRAIRQSGVTMGDDVLVEVDLTVRIDGRPPYDATAYGRAPALVLSQLGPGAIVPVKVSQEDPQAVALDWSFG
jgi:hypothetical protein